MKQHSQRHQPILKGYKISWLIIKACISFSRRLIICRIKQIGHNFSFTHGLNNNIRSPTNILQNCHPSPLTMQPGTQQPPIMIRTTSLEDTQLQTYSNNYPYLGSAPTFPGRNFRHRDEDCPYFQRLQQLEREVAYYRSRCETYQHMGGFSKQTREQLRLSVHRISDTICDKCRLEMVAQKPRSGRKVSVEVSKENKEALKEFSRQLEQIMKDSSNRRYTLQQNRIPNQISHPQPLSDRLVEQMEASNQEISGQAENGEHNKIGSTTQIGMEGIRGIEEVTEQKQQMTQIPSMNISSRATEHSPPASATLKPTDRKDLSMTSPRKSDENTSVAPSEIINNNEMTASRMIRRESMSHHGKKTTINGIISDLCLFGISSQQAEKMVQMGETEGQPKLICSMFNLLEKSYFDQVATYMFTNGIQLKKIKKDRMILDVNQILFQNHKKQHSFVNMFQPQNLDLAELTPPEIELLNRVNPDRKLFCFNILFNDFLMIGQGSQNSNPYSTKRVISLFTFYPFFQFFESLMTALLNTLKIQKLDMYQNKPQVIPQLDGGVFVNKIKGAYHEVVSRFNTAKIVFDYNFQFVFSNDHIRLSTEKNQISMTCLGGWIFTILKMFSKDTFYEVLCAMLFQEQIVFICENLHILTYTIYLFSQILLRPFSYPHAYEFLEAVTPIVLGLNKSNRWLSENTIVGREYSKMYVQLGEEATIYCKPRDKKFKSEKLRRILDRFYKQFDKGLTFFKKKKEEGAPTEFVFTSTLQQKYAALVLIDSIQAYILNEIMKEVPSDAIILTMKDRVLQKHLQGNTQGQDFASEIAEDIQRQIVRNRKEKDPVVEKFIKTQIFLNYIFQKIGDP